MMDEDEENGADQLNGTVKSIDGAKALLAPKPPLTPTQLARKKRREAVDSMNEAAYELFSHFNHKNLDALIKLVKNTLEKLRRRITASQSKLAYNDTSKKGEM